MNKLILIVALMVNGSVSAQTWRSDNSDGTFTNPLFYDEFSDPDLIRVGEDYYLTGTTMHSMPGLPVLHSKDLVNWKFLGYAFDRAARDVSRDAHIEAGKARPFKRIARSGLMLGPSSKSARLGANSELLMVLENVIKTGKTIPSHPYDCSGAISLI
jgi:hypothetical protein